MMQLNLLSVITVFCILSSQCAVGNAASFARAYHHKNHPGKCYINEDLILEGGESRQNPLSCGVYRCTGGEHGFASYETCGVLAVRSNCPLDIDTHAPYPLCCTNAFNCDN